MTIRWKVWMTKLIPKLWQTAKARLEKNGCEVVIGKLPTEPKYSEDEIIEVGKDVDAILVGGERFTAKIFDDLPKLKVMVKSGVGVDNIDVQAATRKGILVANVPVPSDYIGVAEGTVARLLALAKKLTICDKNVKEQLWLTNYEALKGVYLKQEKTIGILGFGRIGSYVARLLKPWGVKIIAFDPYAKKELAELLDVELVEFDTLLTEADFLSIHTTLTPETRNLIDQEALRKMKSTAYVINTARGPIINEEALCKALTEGWIAGAALDVFENEPWTGSCLTDPEISDKLLLSPHVSALSEEMQRDVITTQVDFCLKALNGEPPESTINPDVINKWREKIR